MKHNHISLYKDKRVDTMCSGCKTEMCATCFHDFNRHDEYCSSLDSKQFLLGMFLKNMAIIVKQSNLLRK